MVRLGFVYHTPFWHANDKIVTCHAAIGKYVDSLAPYFSEIILTVPTPAHNDQPQYSLQASNVKLFKLPHYHNIQGFWLYAPLYYAKLIQAAKKWDILTIRMPTHLGFPAFIAARFLKIPVFLVVVGDGLACSRLAKYPLFKQMVTNIEASFQEHLLNFMVDRCLMFANGEDLFRKYDSKKRKVYLTRSSTINQTDIIQESKKRALNNPIRILTVANIEPLKGTVLIPDIIAKLNQLGHNIEWHYIGKVVGSSGERELIRTTTRASELGIKSKIIFHGYITWNELKKYYQNSDLFVLPTYMEGIPRVLLEAQAAGLPLVTTSVGGIPGAVKDGYDALLVPPGDIDAFINKINLVLRDPSLRHGLIEHGLISARKRTLEFETKQMLKKVSRILNMKIMVN